MARRLSLTMAEEAGCRCACSRSSGQYESQILPSCCSATVSCRWTGWHAYIAG